MAAKENGVGKQALAASWALSQMGSRDYYMLCERFIENAYGTSGRYGSASQAGNALGWGTDEGQADVGDLVFFKPDPSNGNYGHVGIYVGNGEMVSATNGGITRDNFQSNPYWKNLFVGFGDPPEQWSGRPATNDLISGAANLVSKAKTAVGNLTGARKAAGDAYWGAAAPYADLIMQSATEHEVPANVLAGLLIQESGGNARAVSRAGAQGLMQFMPGTARGMGVTDPFDPAQSIDAGARYLKQLADQSGGDWEQAVGKYNAGPAGNLNNAETRNHMAKVMQYADTIGAGMGGGADMTGGAPQPNPYRGSDRGAGLTGGPTLDDIMDAVRGARDLTGQAKDAAVGRIQQMLEEMQGRPGPSPAGRLQGSGRLPGYTSEAAARGGVQQGASAVSGLLDLIGRGATAAQQGAGQLGAARDAAMQQRGSLPDPAALPRTSPTGGPSAAAQAGDFFSGLGSAVQGALGGLNGRQAGADFARGALNGALPGAQIGTSAIGPGAPGMPGGGGTPGVTAPPGGGSLTGGPGEEMGPATLTPPAGQPGGPPKARTRSPAWIDPSAYTGINRSTVETANGLTDSIYQAQEELAGLTGTDAKSMIRREELQKAITDAQGRLVTLTPSLQKIEAEEASTREGTVAPGSTPYMKKIPVYRKVDGKWQIEYIDNPNAQEDPSITRQGMQDTAALARQNAADAAALQRQQGSDAAALARQNASDTAAMGRVQAQEAGATERTGMTTDTQRVTTALAQAVEQRRQDIDAQIRSGDLDLRTATEQFNQWYKQNVEAPLAILGQQRETEKYKVQQQEAITNRAKAQSEHERGVATIGQQMWNTASDAYTKMIPLTVGAGWGEGFQKNLQGNGFTPNQGATYNVPESLDQFATRKVAEMLKGVSPYAASLAGAQGQLGDPGQAMGGNQMSNLTNQATGVASNALANPFQMTPPTPFQLPNQVDIAGMAGAGSPNSADLTNQLDQFIPPYGQQGSGGVPQQFTNYGLLGQ
jgi:peptidoglycan DL-endopeptidase CwlO